MIPSVTSTVSPTFDSVVGKKEPDGIEATRLFNAPSEHLGWFDDGRVVFRKRSSIATWDPKNGSVSRLTLSEQQYATLQMVRPISYGDHDVLAVISKCEHHANLLQLLDATTGEVSATVPLSVGVTRQLITLTTNGGSQLIRRSDRGVELLEISGPNITSFDYPMGSLCKFVEAVHIQGTTYLAVGFAGFDGTQRQVAFLKYRNGRVGEQSFFKSGAYCSATSFMVGKHGYVMLVTRSGRATIVNFSTGDEAWHLQLPEGVCPGPKERLTASCCSIEEREILTLIGSNGGLVRYMLDGGGCLRPICQTSLRVGEQQAAACVVDYKESSICELWEVDGRIIKVTHNRSTRPKKAQWPQAMGITALVGLSIITLIGTKHIAYAGLAASVGVAIYSAAMATCFEELNLAQSGTVLVLGVVSIAGMLLTFNQFKNNPQLFRRYSSWLSAVGAALIIPMMCHWAIEPTLFPMLESHDFRYVSQGPAD